MARRTKKTETPSEEDVMEGFPQDGDEIDVQEAAAPAQAEPEEEGDAPASPVSPSSKKLRLGDSEFELDSSTAGAFEALTGMIQDGFASLRQQQAPQEAFKEQNVNKEDPWDGIDELLFSDPKAALSRVRDLTKQELLEQYQRDRQATSQEQLVNQFWNEFWTSHDDLNKRDDQVLVEAVFSKHMDELGKITDNNRLSNRLAELTREEILNLSRRTKTTKTSVESGGTTRTQKKSEPTEEESNVRSIADAVKERRRKRREAMTRTA